VQETRHWNEDLGATASLRSKEEAFDYRYFPEPDIPALEPDPEWIEEIRATLPELPRVRRARYVDELGLKPETAGVLVADRTGVDLFEGAIALGAPAAKAANWITQDLAALVNDSSGEGKVGPEHLAELIGLLDDGTISGAGAKQALEESFRTGASIGAIVDHRSLRQVSDVDALGAIVEKVVADNPEVVEKFRGGNEAVMGFLVGQVMKRSAGAANPQVAKELLRARLEG
jgi:aspartyl-tRNA(Asn)/glutamyl-tRNA(Gln) amidotransferase subunit B